MKKVFFTILIVLWAVTMCLATFLLKKAGDTKPVPNSEETKSNENVLYDYLKENGQLVNGEELVFESGEFVLSADNSRKMYAVNNIHDYNGYDVTVRLSLFEKENSATVTITVENFTSLSEIRCTICPADFTSKTPLKYEVGIESPPINVINNPDYGTTETVDDKIVFRVDEDKREEYEERKQYNEDVITQREERKQIAKELSHKAIEAILDWFNRELPVNAYELGYVNFQD